jgi:glycosyltransferase involved in cell wall biosynthesis
MRIVQFVFNLEVGGLERLAVDLACCQKSAGHDPIIYCLTNRGAFAKQAEASGIPVIAFEKSPGYSVNTVLRVSKQLRRDRPDVLHTHNHLVHHYGVAAGRMAGVPVIVNTRHREEVRIFRKGDRYHVTTESSDKKADGIFRSTLPWTDAVVMISENTRRFFVEHRGIRLDKTHVIVNGAPLNPFLARPASPGSARPKIRFGTAGRMVPAKDHFTLLDAFALVARKLPHAELHFAGDGQLREDLIARISALGISDRVVLHGNRFDMPEYLCQLDVFVLSSLCEGLPIVILEAMAAGLPIVSTRVGGVAEVAPEREVAAYSDPGDASGLADAMIDLALNADLARMGSTARDLVSSRFTIDRTWAEYQALFRKLGAADANGKSLAA